MDIWLSAFNLSAENYRRYLTEIKKSNLPPDIQGELIDLLDTAMQQDQQLRDIGWL